MATYNLIYEKLPAPAVPFYKGRLKYFGFKKKSAKRLFSKWDYNRSLAIRERNERKIELSSFPLYVDVELNNICNLKCRFCPCLQNHNTEKLSEKDINILVEFCRYAEVIETSKGGEPFATPELFAYFLKKLRKINPFAIVHSVTNFSILSEELLKSVALYKLDHIYISINSHDEKLYKKLTGGDFTKVIGNLEKVNATGKIGEPYLHFNCQMTKYADPFKVLDIAHKYGVVEVNFVKTLVNKGHELENDVLQNYLSKEEIELLFDKIAEYANFLGIYVNFSGWDTKPRPVAGKNTMVYYPHTTKYFDLNLICPTDAPWFRLCTSMLLVSPCCWHLSFCKWNERSFNEIWNGEELKGLRKDISEGRYPSGCFCRY